MNLVDKVKSKYVSKNVEGFPAFKAGDTVAVHVRISEGGKSRIQIFKGTCIGTKSGGNLEGHFRVRKISNGIGVERVFPYHSPNVTKVDLISKGKSRRAKFYFLRDRTGKSARVAQDYSKKTDVKK